MMGSSILDTVSHPNIAFMEMVKKKNVNILLCQMLQLFVYIEDKGG